MTGATLASTPEVGIKRFLELQSLRSPAGGGVLWRPRSVEWICCQRSLRRSVNKTCSQAVQLRTALPVYQWMRHWHTSMHARARSNSGNFELFFAVRPFTILCRPSECSGRPTPILHASMFAPARPDTCSCACAARWPLARHQCRAWARVARHCDAGLWPFPASRVILLYAVMRDTIARGRPQFADLLRTNPLYRPT